MPSSGEAPVSVQPFGPWQPPAPLIYVWNDRYPSSQYVWGDGCYGSAWYWGQPRGDGWHGYADVGYRPDRATPGVPSPSNL